MAPKLFLGNLSRRLLGVKLTNWVSQFAIARWMRFPAAWVASKIAEKAVDLTLQQNSPPQPQSDPGTQERVMWQVWLQGWESAPDIVKAIQDYNSAALPGITFKRLSLEDALGLVDISPLVLEHFNSGKISPAGFTDLLRLKLIAKHGGIWADATVLFSPEFQGFHKSHESFMLQWDYDISSTKRWNFTLNSWLFAAERHDNFVQLWGDALEAMWKKNGQTEYFDAFYVATVLQKRGKTPTTNLVQADSYELNKAGTSFFSLFLLAKTTSEAEALLARTLFHKFSYKIGSVENQRAIDLIRACIRA